MQTELESCFTRHRDRYLAEWKELLAFPSVSTDPRHAQDCLNCADWLVRQLAAIGFEARLLPTPSKPVVYAERAGDPTKPVVLFYGHYDVQPVDPLDEWVSPPFEATLRDGRLYARGAQDNKGQLLYALKALETLIELQALRPTVKIVIEGEEESGSRGIAQALPGWRDLLRADVLLVTDTGSVAPGAGTIVMGLRGIFHLTVVLGGPHHDLHSGVHGGRAPNPAEGLAALLAGLHGADGRIAVPGFYDSVRMPSPWEREMAARIPFSPEVFAARNGVPPVAGEREFTPVERVGFRPSLDINGMHSGFGGEGTKTIIPARAMAKLTARLAAGQNPESCLRALIAHLQANTPQGLRLEVTEQGIGGPALRLNPDSPLVAKARGVLDTLTGHDTVFLWEGASIPLVTGLAAVSGAEPLLVGFGLEEDRMHAPNESFALEQFRLGYLYVGLMLNAL
jgi:acetylornithine deacetylase/succinyl-diaminopimelate desuccinylase-like protein